MNDHIPKSILFTYKTKKYYELTDSLNKIETRYMNRIINRLVISYILRNSF